MLKNLQGIRFWQRFNLNVPKTGPPISDQRIKKNRLGQKFFLRKLKTVLLLSYQFIIGILMFPVRPKKKHRVVILFHLIKKIDAVNLKNSRLVEIKFRNQTRK
jgi:hypothetical protein